MTAINKKIIKIITSCQNQNHLLVANKFVNQAEKRKLITSLEAIEFQDMIRQRIEMRPQE